MNTTLILELTNLCNLKCVMCELPDTKVRKGFITLELVEKVLKDLKENKLHFNLLLPFWAGESSIHPQFGDIIRLIFEYNRDHLLAGGLGMDTNLNAFEKEDIDLILSENQFVVIHFSLDAVSENTYKKIRIGGNFKKAISNAEYFLKKRRLNGMKYPHFVFQFIVMEENHEEIKEFVDFWSERLGRIDKDFQINYFYDKPAPITKDTIFIRRCDAPNGETSLQIKYDNLHKKAVKAIFGNEYSECLTNEFREDKNGKNIYTGSMEREVCAGPFTHLSVKFDGRVTLCCQDTEAELAIGDANKESITDIWYGKKAEKLRNQHISGDLPNRCVNCFNQIYPLINRDDCYKMMKKLKK